MLAIGGCAWNTQHRRPSVSGRLESHGLLECLSHPCGVLQLAQRRLLAALTGHKDGNWHTLLPHLRSRISRPPLRRRDHAQRLYCHRHGAERDGQNRGRLDKKAAARLPLFGQRACLSTRIVRQGLVVILEGNDGTRLRTGPGDVHRSFEVAYSIAELLCRLRRHCSGACVSDLSAIACQCSDPVFAEISPHKSSCGGVMKEKPIKSA